MSESTMTPRNRVLASLNHEQPDRIPVDLSGHRSSGIAAIAYAKAAGVSGLEKRPVRVYDVQQQLAVVHDDVLDRFGIDTIELGRGLLSGRLGLGRLGSAGRDTLPVAGVGSAGTGS